MTQSVGSQEPAQQAEVWAGRE
eukprot:SAG22_NODE_9320_length_596_cov_1.140845_1_plen_21_part_10